MMILSSIQDRASVLRQRFADVRAFTLALCEPLCTEDFVVQTMPDASPTKWHLAHTTWFFEVFILKAFMPDYRSAYPDYEYIFNSYYNAVGAQFPRPQRGLLSRPTVAEVMHYRREIEAKIHGLLDAPSSADNVELLTLLELGIHHEQQHQELLITDIKTVFANNPLFPVYLERLAEPAVASTPLDWLSHPGGLQEIGFAGEGFAYDNEGPRHKLYLEPFQLADRPVSNGEYLAFVQDGGYDKPQHWLSEGWAFIQAEGIQRPLYWHLIDGECFAATLSGLLPLALDEPVCHVSYFEADAFASWAGARLPREGEWEVLAANAAIAGGFAENGRFHPAPKAAGFFGDVWEWTSSSYAAYPGYKAAPGAVGEYNGKFMCNQYVLRGGSCATPQSHIRASYRNFFPASARWQFSGIRLAKDDK